MHEKIVAVLYGCFYAEGKIPSANAAIQCF